MVRNWGCSPSCVLKEVAGVGCSAATSGGGAPVELAEGGRTGVGVGRSGGKRLGEDPSVEAEPARCSAGAPAWWRGVAAAARLCSGRRNRGGGARVWVGRWRRCEARLGVRRGVGDTYKAAGRIGVRAWVGRPAISSARIAASVARGRETSPTAGPGLSAAGEHARAPTPWAQVAGSVRG
jgi:hypothetical protein